MTWASGRTARVYRSATHPTTTHFQVMLLQRALRVFIAVTVLLTSSVALQVSELKWRSVTELEQVLQSFNDDPTGEEARFTFRVSAQEQGEWITRVSTDLHINQDLDNLTAPTCICMLHSIFLAMPVAATVITPDYDTRWFPSCPCAHPCASCRTHRWSAPVCSTSA